MVNLPAGITSQTLRTARLSTHYLERPGDGPVIVFVHGNVSSSRFYAETMAAFPAGYRLLAPDFRGYGASERLPIDATRGVGDFTDDLVAFLDGLGVEQAHFVGWSVGGGVVQQFFVDHPERVLSVTLEATMSPFGFGGTRDAAGVPHTDDGAGAGGGAANPMFVASMAAGDRSTASEFTARSIYRAFYVHPSFSTEPAVEDAYVDAMLDMALGDAHYPGNSTSSPHWPGFAPGDTGMNNAISGRYTDTSAFADVERSVPVLWIRGADDQIVGDQSLFEIGALGALGLVPGWPGAEAFPPQPMLAQIRGMLDRYAAKGNGVKEVVLDTCGHSPHIEHPDRFRKELLELVQGV